DLPHAPLSPLFPYTTLFRSALIVTPGRRHHPISPVFVDDRHPVAGEINRRGGFRRLRRSGRAASSAAALRECRGGDREQRDERRSEEHTSELQSRSDLVCRL